MEIRPKLLCYLPLQRQVESLEAETEFQLQNVASALLFESPAELYRRVFQTIRPRTPVPEIHVEFCRFANANSSIRLAEGRLKVRIADVLEGAPAPVAEALAFILVSKLYRQKPEPAFLHRYRLWLSRKDVRHHIHLVRQLRGRKRILPPAGRKFDLEEIFERLNLAFFDGLMARPALGWSLQESRTRLGHYDPSHNAIVLSRVLDQEHVPAHVAEYVMYHEMLHLRHPEEHCQGRRRIHTPAFQEAERRFPNLAEAKRALRTIASNGL